MKAKDYIKDKIDNLVKDFPEIQCRYEWDEFSGSHYVEVLPKEFYESKSFTERHKNIILEFIDLFPYESLSFHTEGSAVDLEDVIYTRKGEQFGKVST